MGKHFMALKWNSMEIGGILLSTCFRTQHILLEVDWLHRMSRVFDLHELDSLDDCL